MDLNPRFRPSPQTTWRPMTTGARSRPGFADRRSLDRNRDHMERCKSAPYKYRATRSPSPVVKINPQTVRKIGWEAKPSKSPGTSLPRGSNVSAYDEFDEDYDFDKWSDDEEPADDPSQIYKKVYEAACRDLRTTPVDSFSRQLVSNGTDINLRYKLLTPNEVKAIAVTLVKNITAQRLDLSGNDIGPTGTGYIAQVLKENSFLTELDLSSTNPGKTGLKALSAVVKNSNSLRVLNLSGNEFDIGHAQYLADIISTNVYLQTLDLSYNRLGDDGGQILGPAIGDNISITDLNLKWNHLRMRGAIAVARGIEENSRLERVDLSWNGFGLEGCEAMAAAIANNQTLKELSMACNRIDIGALEKLMEGVVKNDSIQILRLGLNPMTTDGAMYLLKKLKETPTSEITELDITDVPVDKHFQELMTEIQSSRTLHVRHGMLFRVNDIRQEPEVNDFKHFDPLMILYQYMREDNLRLIDVLHSFDVNRDDCLTRDEFRNGFLSVNIPVTENGLDVLLKKLDLNGDGKVDFTELGEGHRQIRRKVSTLMHKLRESNVLNAKADEPSDEPYSKLQGLVKDAVTTKRASKASPRKSVAAVAGKPIKGGTTVMPTLTEITELNNTYDETNELDDDKACNDATEESDEDLLELAHNLRQLFHRHSAGNTLRLVFKATSAFNKTGFGKLVGLQ